MIWDDDWDYTEDNGDFYNYKLGGFQLVMGVAQ